jgi:hypothetical protein
VLLASWPRQVVGGPHARQSKHRSGHCAAAGPAELSGVPSRPSFPHQPVGSALDWGEPGAFALSCCLFAPLLSLLPRIIATRGSPSRSGRTSTEQIHDGKKRESRLDNISETRQPGFQYQTVGSRFVSPLYHPPVPASWASNVEPTCLARRSILLLGPSRPLRLVTQVHHHHNTCQLIIFSLSYRSRAIDLVRSSAPFSSAAWCRQPATFARSVAFHTDRLSPVYV